MSYFSEIEQHKKYYEELAVKTVERALRKGADQVKVKIGGGKGVTVTARNGEVENIEFNRAQGMGVRVYRDQRCSSVSTNDFSEDSIEKAVDAALNLCNYTSPDEFGGLSDPEDHYKGDTKVNVLFELSDDPDAIVKRAIDLEKLGIARIDEFKDQGLTKSDGSVYSVDYDLETIATSNGFCHSKAESTLSKYMGFVGERDGVMQTGSSGLHATTPAAEDEWTDEKVVDEAIERTLSKLGARKVKTGKYNIIFRHVASGFMGTCLGALTGSLIYQNSSYLKDKLNEQIFPTFMTIKEDPWIEGGLGSSIFDSDCVYTRPLTLVENGVLKEFLLGTYSARKLGMRCNGHNDPLYNTFVQADAAYTKSLEQMMQEMGSGIVVDSLMGQGVNLVNGNFSRGASGFYFENGERVHAVHEITVAGNLLDMGLNIAAVGTDIDSRRLIQTGSLLIPDITVSGL